MKQETILCDKCKKDITNTIHWVEHLSNDNYIFDFCDDCHGKFLKAIGTWINTKETNNG